MADKCPYCFRSIGTWTNDPLLLPEGSPYDWSSDTELISVPNIDSRYYKGFSQIKEEDVKEIQDSLKTLEEENLDEGERTKFSPLNSSGYFQITGQHIKEMRESVEKLLEALGLTKTDYFNYDEEGNHIISPDGDKVEWTDKVENEADWDKFQVKAIHIEDLRHYLAELIKEKWRVSSPQIIATEDDGNPLFLYYSLPTVYIYNRFIWGDLGYWVVFYFPGKSRFELKEDEITRNKYAVLEEGTGDYSYIKLRTVQFMRTIQSQPPPTVSREDYSPPPRPIRLSENYNFGLLYNLNGVMRITLYFTVVGYYLFDYSCKSSPPNDGWSGEDFLEPYTYEKLEIYCRPNYIGQRIFYNSQVLFDHYDYLGNWIEETWLTYYNHAGMEEHSMRVNCTNSIDTILELDLWNLLVLYYKDTYYLKDYLGNPILDEEGNKQPTTWFLESIEITLDGGGGSKLFKVDDIGLIKREI